jgi:hypothetical protein
LSLDEGTSGNVMNLFALVYRYCLQGMAEFHKVRAVSADRHYYEGPRLAENEDDRVRSQDLRKECESVGSRYLAPRVSMHLAILLWRARQVANSLDEFASVAAVGAENGICQIILDEGTKLDALLTEFHEAANRRQKLVPYVSGLPDLRRRAQGPAAGASTNSGRCRRSHGT